jgi:glycine/D-amino acid oxidase-like deaminating enzyme
VRIVIQLDQADVVIIGGGIVGCAAAYYLAKRNAKVILVEKGRIGGEQSSRAWGFVRIQGRDPDEVPLMIESNRIWRNLEAELEADIEWVQGGNLAIARDGERAERFRDWMPVARDFGVETQILTGKQIEALIPGIRGPFSAGMYTAADGHAEPGKATEAFANAAREHGADIRTYCAAEGFEIVNGQIGGVHTEQGLIFAPVVINAAGGHAAKLARMVDLTLPQRIVRATVAETTPVAPVTPIGTWAPGVSFRQKQNGSFYLAGGASSIHDITLESFRQARMFLPNYLKNRRIFQMRVGRELLDDVVRALPVSASHEHPFAHTVDVEPEPDRATAVKSIKGFVELFPELRGKVKIRRMWAGMIDATPDAVPVIGEAGDLPGFIFATGFSGHGFAFGPIAGKLLSELILDGHPSLDLHAFRFSRFAEGELRAPKNVL